MMKRAIAGLAALALIPLAACSSGSKPAHRGFAISASSTQLICKHYLAQYQWERNLTFPTPADALKWEGYVAVDYSEAPAASQLHHDLGQELAAMRDKKNTYKNGTVYAECLRIR